MEQSASKRATFYWPFLWQISIACFILAAFTGFLYRLGMIGHLPVELGLENIRHAHSHLMFFGWAVPFPLYILLNYIYDQKLKHRSGIKWMKAGIVGSLTFGIIAYPFFLLFGYRPVEIGSASLPLSVIFSGLVMISWYVYMLGYLKLRTELTENNRPWFDGALLLLLICSLGAWGIAVVQAAAPTNQLLLKSLTHFFLATFTEGWVVLALMAILISQLGLKEQNWIVPQHIALSLICIGAPLTFPYGISESLLTPFLLGIARLGGALTSAGLLLALASILRISKWKSTLWIWPMVFLILKALMQLAASVMPPTFWMSDHGLRIFYLHVLLLGAFTITIAAWLNIQADIPRKYFTAVGLSIVATLVTLILPTGLWPTAWSGNWIFYVLAGGALLPLVAIAAQWISMIKTHTCIM